MKASDFRLANWITDSEGVNFKITKIAENKIEAGPLMISSLGLETEEWGIPLTPEWLERFGMKKCENHMHEYFIGNNENDQIVFNWNPISKDVHSVGIRHNLINDDLTNFAWHIRYVHQVQNIFHALTGKELELKS